MADTNDQNRETLKYGTRYVWVLETTHGYYPIPTWGFASHLGDDEVEARAQLRYWLSRSGEYRLYNNQTGEIITALEELSSEESADQDAG